MGAVNNDASSDNFTDITPYVQYDNNNAWLVIWSRNQGLNPVLPDMFQKYSMRILWTPWSRGPLRSDWEMKQDGNRNY